MVGRQIARYRIVEQIGSGGMSVVYKGVDTALDREVAVKVLHPHLASREDSRRRFSREAKAVARLHHPNILEIFDFSGDEAPESFIVTEYIRGGTLRSFAERVPFHPPEIAVIAVHELACALEHAHDQGIIHRDLKPENVMIREDGVIKLMDFGIAKVLDRDEKMTMTGALVGSPAHMAPEIIEGLEIGREADIFSLGTILYWLCCRKLPFQGQNTTQTLKLILDGTYPDPRIDCPAVSDELAAVIAQCLARDPKARYAAAGEMREALADLLAGVGIDRPGEEFQAFFSDPDGYRARLQRRLVERFLTDAEVAVEARNQLKALDLLNRVLALEPSSERAKELLERMAARRRARKRLLAAASALAVLVAGGGSFAAWKNWPRAPHPVEPVVAEPAARPAASGQAEAALTTSAGGGSGQQSVGELTPGVAVAGPATELAVGPLAPWEAAAAEVSLWSPPSLPRSEVSPSAPIDLGEPASGEAQPHRTGRSLPRPPGSAPVTASKATVGGRDDEPAALAPGPQAEKQFGEVKVEARNPAGEQVYMNVSVDGVPQRNLGPVFRGNLEAGKRLIRVDTTCCGSEERLVEVKPGNETPPVLFRLLPGKATVRVAADADADVYLAMGKSSRMVGKVGPRVDEPLLLTIPGGRTKARVRLLFARPGLPDEPYDVELTANQESEIKLEFQP